MLLAKRKTKMTAFKFLACCAFILQHACFIWMLAQKRRLAQPVSIANTVLLLAKTGLLVLVIKSYLKNQTELVYVKE